jgi:hypothetical protein
MRNSNHWQMQLELLRQYAHEWPIQLLAMTAIAERAQLLERHGLPLDEQLEAVTQAQLWLEGAPYLQAGNQFHHLMEVTKSDAEMANLYGKQFHLLGTFKALKTDLAKSLWVRVVVDAAFAVQNHPDSHILDTPSTAWRLARDALSQLEFRPPETIDAASLYVELTTQWPASPECHLAHLEGRYQHLRNHPVIQTLSNSHEMGRIMWELTNYDIKTDRASFANFLAQRAPGWTPANPDTVPGYRFVETLWNQFFCHGFLNPSGWMLGRLRLSLFNGDTGPSHPWRYDEAAATLPYTLALAIKKARVAALNIPSYVRRTEMPEPWLEEGQAGVQLLWNRAFPVYYGAFTLDASPDNGMGQDESFSGQNNGLLGAQRLSALAVRTALHTGNVHLCVALCDAEPPMPDVSWQELVEASLWVPHGKPMLLNDWNGDLCEPLAIPSGWHRVRLAAARFGVKFKAGCRTESESDESNAEPTERYTLALWPESNWREDAVLRLNHPSARERHAQAAGWDPEEHAAAPARTPQQPDILKDPSIVAAQTLHMDIHPAGRPWFLLCGKYPSQWSDSTFDELFAGQNNGLLGVSGDKDIAIWNATRTDTFSFGVMQHDAAPPLLDDAELEVVEATVRIDENTAWVVAIDSHEQVPIKTPEPGNWRLRLSVQYFGGRAKSSEYCEMPTTVLRLDIWPTAGKEADAVIRAFSANAIARHDRARHYPPWWPMPNTPANPINGSQSTDTGFVLITADEDWHTPVEALAALQQPLETLTGMPAFALQVPPERFCEVSFEYHQTKPELPHPLWLDVFETRFFVPQSGSYGVATSLNGNRQYELSLGVGWYCARAGFAAMPGPFELDGCQTRQRVAIAVWRCNAPKEGELLSEVLCISDATAGRLQERESRIEEMQLALQKLPEPPPLCLWDDAPVAPSIERNELGHEGILVFSTGKIEGENNKKYFNENRSFDPESVPNNSLLAEIGEESTDHLVAIFGRCEAALKVEIYGFDGEPPPTSDFWTDVAEASLEIKPGDALTLREGSDSGCPSGHRLILGLDAGIYRVRLAAARLDIAQRLSRFFTFGSPIGHLRFMFWPEPVRREAQTLRCSERMQRIWAASAEQTKESKLLGLG